MRVFINKREGKEAGVGTVSYAKRSIQTTGQNLRICEGKRKKNVHLSGN
jgi:hypothetical protein